MSESRRTFTQFGVTVDPDELDETAEQADRIAARLRALPARMLTSQHQADVDATAAKLDDIGRTLRAIAKYANRRITGDKPVPSMLARLKPRARAAAPEPRQPFYPGDHVLLAIAKLAAHELEESDRG